MQTYTTSWEEPEHAQTLSSGCTKWNGTKVIAIAPNIRSQKLVSKGKQNYDSKQRIPVINPVVNGDITSAIPRGCFGHTFTAENIT